MKYVSIDIETTGKESATCDILSIGAVIEDTNEKLPWDRVPKFYAIIPRKIIKGEPFAIEMNKELISLIANWNEANSYNKFNLNERVVSGFRRCIGGFLEENELVKSFLEWLALHGVISQLASNQRFNVAGKNFGVFDKPFLDKIPDWAAKVDIRHRLLDPATLFTDFQKDETLPNMAKCMERAGIPGEVTHNALQDAWDVVQVLRTKY